MSVKESKKSEKPEKSEKSEKPDGASGEGGEKAGKKGGLLSKTPVLLGGVMILEAVLLFGGFKFFGASPKPAGAADLSQPETHDEAKKEGADEHGGSEEAHKEGGEEGANHGGDHGGGAGHAMMEEKKVVEVKVLEYKAINNRDGRTRIYDVAVQVTTKGKFKHRLESAIADHDAMIKDRVRTIIAQCDPEKLGGGTEPGLETFRRQVKYQLDEIVGEGMIDEVLVPRCIPYRAD